MIKHTPGPWRVEGGTTLVWGACDSEDQSSLGMGYPITKCHTLLGPEPYHKRGARPDEAEANAHLIAAAPDLLEALQIAVKALHEAEAILGGEYGDHYGPFCEMMIKLEYAAGAVITKATSI